MWPKPPAHLACSRQAARGSHMPQQRQSLVPAWGGALARSQDAKHSLLYCPARQQQSQGVLARAEQRWGGGGAWAARWPLAALTATARGARRQGEMLPRRAAARRSPRPGLQPRLRCRRAPPPPGPLAASLATRVPLQTWREGGWSSGAATGGLEPRRPAWAERRHRGGGSGKWPLAH